VNKILLKIISVLYDSIKLGYITRIFNPQKVSAVFAIPTRHKKSGAEKPGSFVHAWKK